MNTQTSRLRRRPDAGFALAAAILALVVVGVLVTGGFYIAQQETRIGMATENSALAFYLAERGITDVLEDWDAATYSGLSTWSPTTVTDTVAEGIYEVEITRMADFTYLLDATGTITRGGAVNSGASRRMGMIAKLRTATLNPPAALTTQGTIKYGGSAEIHGMDLSPDGSGGGQADWASSGVCSAYGTDNKPGLLIDDTMNIDWNGNRNKVEGNMNGTPKFGEDPSIDASSLLDFGDMDWDQLVSLADKSFMGSVPNPAPSVVSGRCNIASTSNWGDPLNTASPCFDYYPIIYIGASGTTNLTGGYGQGILLVENDIKVTGGFEWYGPIYVKGTLTTMGSGGHFWGGVVAANVNLDTNTVLGNAEIQYSSCAITRALLLNANLTRPEPLAERNWVDLSNLTGR